MIALLPVASRLRLMLLAVACVGACVGPATAHAGGWYKAGALGTPSAAHEMSIPHAIDIAADGSFYVAGYGDHLVQHFAADGTWLGQFAAYGTGAGELDRPVGLTVAPDGSIYVAEQNHRVQRYSPQGALLGSFGSFGSGPGQFDQPDGLDFAPDGTLWVADPVNNRVEHFTADGGLLGEIGSMGVAPGQFKSPRDVAVASDGSLWITDKDNYRVQHLDPAGAPLGSFGSLGAGPGQFAWPEQVDIAADGSLFVGDRTNNRVEHFSAAGAFLGQFGAAGTAAGQYNNVEAVAIAADGSIWTSDLYNHRLQHVSAAGAWLATVNPNGPAGTFNEPRSVAHAPDGSFVVAERYNHRIQRFAADGTWLWSYGSLGAGAGQLNLPMGAAIAPDGTVYVTDTGNNRVVQVAADGSSQLLAFGSAGATNGTFNAPGGIAFAPDGTLLVVDRNNGRIQRFTAAGAWLATYGAPGATLGKLSGVNGIAVASDGSFWVSEAGNDRVQHFDASGTGLATIGALGTNPGQFTDPTGVAIGSDGSIYVAGEYDHRVQRFAPDGTLLDSIGASFGTEAGPALRPWGVDIVQGVPYIINGGTHQVERWVWDGTGPHGASSTIAYRTGVATITVAGAVDGESGLSSQPYSFDGGVTWQASPSHDVTLSGGAQTLAIAVRDRVGNVTSLVATTDGLAPSIDRGGRWPRAYAGRARLSMPFSISDAEAGVATATATFHGVTIPVTDGSISLVDLPEGRGRLVVHAADRAGNVATWTTPLVVDRTSPVLLGRTDRHVLSANVTFAVHDSISGVSSSRIRVHVDGYHRNRVKLLVRDRAGNSAWRVVIVTRHMSLAHASHNRGLRVRELQRTDELDQLSTPVARELQWRLKRFGYLSCDANGSGRITPATIDALERFQAAHHIDRAAVLGTRTRVALDEALIKLRPLAGRLCS